MNFKQIVQYIKEEGCRVYIYEKKEEIYGGNRGTFHYNEHGPIICLAAKTDARRKMETLLHEYGHFLQWKDGFLDYLDNICNAYEVQVDWVNHQVELSDREIKTARNAMLAMEYDAERRAIKAAEMFCAEDFCENWYASGAAAYMDSIKWEWKRRAFTEDVLSRKLYVPKFLTNEELFAPLSNEQLEKLDKSFKVSRRQVIK